MDRVIFKITGQIRKFLKKIGLEVHRAKHRNSVWFPSELEAAEKDIIQNVLDNEWTMVSFERAVSTALAVKYVLENGIEGDFVECGVWRGGNSIIAAKLFSLHRSDRRVWLYDTFTGMTEPTAKDVDMYGAEALKNFNNLPRNSSETRFWCISSLEEVKDNFRKSKLQDSNLKFIVGDVLETLNEKVNIPEKISVLRLDTDWYESTFKELEILYPRLTSKGCLIIDDYGHWNGSRVAVDEYFSKSKHRPFLHPIDNTGRIGIKI
jgi:O-methyltransferase